MKAAAVVNPKSASGKTGKLWASLAPRINIEFAKFTEAPGHATTLARELLEQGFDRIIAVGGDGTINEVVNGFLDNDQAINPEAELAILPIGTGSDFQRSVPAREASPIDIAKISYRAHDGSTRTRYFANLTSFGMGGEVAAGAKNFLTIFGGKAAFLYSTLKVFVTYRPKTATLILDGQEHGPYTITNIAMGNGGFHGGGMHVCPKAHMDDGVLEVTVIEYLRMLEARP